MTDSKTRASASGAPPKIHCPKCKKQVIFQTTNSFRPFCSARCREADLAAWAGDQYFVPGKPVLADDNQDDEDSHT